MTMKVIIAALLLAAHACNAQTLGGQEYNITVVIADGFVTKTADGGFEGYIVDMIEAVSKLADFSYTLKTPSGYGSSCNPQVSASEDAYDAMYESNFLCGQEDVLDASVPADFKTDMYWSTYFVTTSRQEQGKFSIAFKPPFGGLTMYGVATGIKDIPALIAAQKSGDVGPACVGENTAYAGFLATALPDLETVGVANTDAGFLEAMTTDVCTVAINAEPLAVRFVKKRETEGTCEVGGMPIGVIGESLQYGLTQMAVGMSNDIPEDEIRVINFWLNTLMTCAPEDCPDDASLYKSWTKWAGSGDLCGYENNPNPSGAASVLISSVTALLLSGVMSFMVM